MFGRNLRGFRVLDAVAIAALYVACADPPRKILPLPVGSGGRANAGTGGTGGKGGMAGTSVAEAGTGGSTGGKGGKGGKGGNGGKGGGAGTGTTSGAGGTGGDVGGTSGASGEAGMPAGAGGEAGVSGGTGGEAGTTGASGQAGVGEGGSSGTNPCTGVTVGTPSDLPAAPTTGVAKPAGAQGNLSVLNWAGFGSALSFTFDDATQSQLDHYAELNAVGVRMTFYLVCANDGSKPGWTTAANDGHEIGNHTMHHCNANGSGCGWGAFTTIDAEIDDCTTHLETAFGVPGVYTMASPMGDANWDAPASARFIVNRGVYDNQNGVMPKDATNPYDLPCHIANLDEKAVGGFNNITDSVRTKGSWRIILAHALGANDGYNPVDPAEVVATMNYAKGFGDVWIDTVKNIGSYWRAQKTLSTVAPVTDGDDITYSWTLPDHFPPGQHLRVTVDGGTVKQCGTELSWDDHGYYEIALDAGSVTISP